MKLFADLDGTLINTDLLFESILVLLKKNIFYLFLLPVWLLQGKANLKYQIASRVNLRVDLLPYNAKFIAYLEEMANSDRELILISASNEKLVKAVATHISIFSQAIGSTEQINFKGSNKLRKIKEICGDQKFDYAGDNAADLAIWKEADGAILVNASAAVKTAAEKLTTIKAEFPNDTNRVKASLKALRLHQWLKNALLFLPLVLSHQLANQQLFVLTVLSFFAFGLCASSVYIMNDVLDLEADRQHDIKKFRSFAAGDLAISFGLALSALLLLAAFAITILLLPLSFLIVLSSYYLITFLYSVYLKTVMVVDVLTLAGLYTIRIIAGAAVIHVSLTFWLLAFSMFLFLSLAIVKRVSELWKLRKNNKQQAEGRGYQADDLPILSMLGCASGLMSVLVFALYINADETRVLYQTPETLWLICPLLLYVISRIWLIAHRGKLHHDPVVFVIKDSRSQFAAVLCALLFWLATGSWLGSVYSRYFL